MKPYGVIVDALVELGRYDAAERALQRMVDLKPNLDSYARVSYFRELHGDIDRRRSRRCGSPPPRAATRARTSPTCRRCSATSSSHAADVGAARGAYSLALSRYPEYVPAQAGLARAAAARGDLAAAIRRYERVVERLPLPEYAVALAEAELAAGRRADAREDLALVEVQQRLLRRGGVNVDAEMAIVEADHGSPERAVRLARGSLGGRAQRARGGRARLGADAGRRTRPGTRVRAARAAARLA